MQNFNQLQLETEIILHALNGMTREEAQKRLSNLNGYSHFVRMALEKVVSGEVS